MNDETPTQEVPMPDTTALEILKGQVESLTAQLQKLTSERDEYRDALTGVSEERDKLKAEVWEPSELQDRVRELEGSIRERAHFDKFAELANGAKAKPGAVKHLWQVSGYKP